MKSLVDGPLDRDEQFAYAVSASPVQLWTAHLECRGTHSTEAQRCMTEDSLQPLHGRCNSYRTHMPNSAHDPDTAGLESPRAGPLR